MRLDEFHGSQCRRTCSSCASATGRIPSRSIHDTRKAFESWTPPLERAATTAAATVERSRTSTKIVGAANLAECIRRYGHLAARIDPLGFGADRRSVTLAGGSRHHRRRSASSCRHRSSAARSRSRPRTRSRRSRSSAASTARRPASITAHVFVPEEREWLRHAAESRPIPAADGRAQHARRCSIASRRSRCSSDSCTARFPARRASRSKGSTCSCRSSTRSSAARPTSGARHAMLGMAHRGRLNVLAHVLDKPYAQILAEFKDPVAARSFRTDLGWMGDVKYHAGARTAAPRGQMHITMPPNPSHLEAVDPVARAAWRARPARTPISRAPRTSTARVTLPILIHGDAAFPGPGRRRRDAEPVAARRLRHRRHDSHHREQSARVHRRRRTIPTAPATRAAWRAASRSRSCTSTPTIRSRASRRRGWRWEYRARFGLDFLIDLVGYRRHGHNEGDEPSFTQPMMYKAVASHPTVREIWARTLVETGHDSARGCLTRWSGNTSTSSSRAYASLEPEQELRAADAAATAASRHRRAGRDGRAARSASRDQRGAARAVRKDSRFTGSSNADASGAVPRSPIPTSDRLTGRQPRSWRSATILADGIADPHDRRGRRARHVQPPPRRLSRRRYRQRS